MNERVHPAGGLRVWNEYDAIPYIGKTRDKRRGEERRCLIWFNLVSSVATIVLHLISLLTPALFPPSLPLSTPLLLSTHIGPALSFPPSLPPPPLCAFTALLVGYQHAGVPIKTRLKKNAKDLFQNVSVNTIAAALDVVSPHILFQIGE